MPKIKVPTSPLKRPAKLKTIETPPSPGPPCKPEKLSEAVQEKKNALKMKERLQDLLKEMNVKVTNECVKTEMLDHTPFITQSFKC